MAQACVAGQRPESRLASIRCRRLIFNRSPIEHSTLGEVPSLLVLERRRSGCSKARVRLQVYGWSYRWTHHSDLQERSLCSSVLRSWLVTYWLTPKVKSIAQAKLKLSVEFQSAADRNIQEICTRMPSRMSSLFMENCSEGNFVNFQGHSFRKKACNFGLKISDNFPFSPFGNSAKFLKLEG